MIFLEWSHGLNKEDRIHPSHPKPNQDTVYKNLFHVERVPGVSRIRTKKESAVTTDSYISPQRTKWYPESSNRIVRAIILKIKGDPGRIY